MKKIPTILLTGFLGAGKTTLLNRLIEFYTSRRTVLLINEFGKTGIDGQMLAEGNYEKIELNKGSLFCICVRTDFIDEVAKIARDIQPELLIIEATGLADTSEMEKMLALPNLIDKIHLQACVCLVDAQNFHKIKDTLRAPVSQVKSADLVLVNKTDLVSPDRLQATIGAVKAISPEAQVIPTRFADFSLDTLTDINRPQAAVSGMPGEGRPDLVLSVTLQAEGSFTEARWDAFKAMLPADTLRAKGFITIDNALFHLDATAEQWTLAPTNRLPVGTNRLVIIAPNLDEYELSVHFQRALV